MEASLRADAWALQQIAAYQGGKVLLWSWVSRGLTTMEQVASWYFNDNIEAAKEALSSTPGAMASLCKLDEIPDVDCTAEETQVVQAESSMLDGELSRIWAIEDPEVTDPVPIGLPSWFTTPIDKAVLLWRQEASKWDERIQKRHADGKDSLTPAMQRLYDKWLEDTTRSIVLDKRKEVEVKNLGDQSISKLQKHCVLLVIHMSTTSEDLRIKSGSGKLWKLKLLEGTISSGKAIPDEVDHFEGLDCLHILTAHH